MEIFQKLVDYHAIFHIDEQNLGIMCPNDLQVKLVVNEYTIDCHES